MHGFPTQERDMWRERLFVTESYKVGRDTGSESCTLLPEHERATMRYINDSGSLHTKVWQVVSGVLPKA